MVMWWVVMSLRTVFPESGGVACQRVVEVGVGGWGCRGWWRRLMRRGWLLGWGRLLGRVLIWRWSCRCGRCCSCWVVMSMCW